MFTGERDTPKRHPKKTKQEQKNWGREESEEKSCEAAIALDYPATFFVSKPSFSVSLFLSASLFLSLYSVVLFVTLNFFKVLDFFFLLLVFMLN